MPEAGEDVLSNAANGGRVQSIAVNPTNRDNAIIAMQFGGLWKTYNAGQAWFRIYTLPRSTSPTSSMARMATRS
jgi:hypothetical protein